MAELGRARPSQLLQCHSDLFYLSRAALSHAWRPSESVPWGSWVLSSPACLQSVFSLNTFQEPSLQSREVQPTQTIRALSQEESKRAALFKHLNRVKIMVIALAGRQIII